MFRKKNKAAQSAPIPKPKFPKPLLAAFVVSITIAALWLWEHQRASRLQTELEEIRVQKPEQPHRTEVRAVAYGRTCFDHLRCQAEELPGTKEALRLVERTGNGPVDIVRLNCLIARDIPECATLNFETVDAWYSKVAERIGEGQRKYFQTPEGQADVAKHGEARVRIQSMGYFLAKIQKVDYVENDVYRPDWPWHSFCFGIVKEGRGSCVTMALMWKIVGDKLGMPLTFRDAPRHLYVHWKDSHDDFNVEPTAYGQSFDDTKYRERWGVTLEQQTSGAYMHDMTPKQILANFLSSRAAYWTAKEECVKAFADTLLALSLDPNCPSHKFNAINSFCNAQDQFAEQIAQLIGRERLGEVKSRLALEHADAVGLLKQAQPDLENPLDILSQIPDMAPRVTDPFAAIRNLGLDNPARISENRWRMPEMYIPSMNPPVIGVWPSRKVYGIDPYGKGGMGAPHFNPELMGPQIPNFRMGSIPPESALPNIGGPLNPKY